MLAKCTKVIRAYIATLFQGYSLVAGHGAPSKGVKVQEFTGSAVSPDPYLILVILFFCFGYLSLHWLAHAVTGLGGGMVSGLMNPKRKL